MAARVFTIRPGLEPYPGYKTIQLLGRGGYAEVWEAESPEGRIALKFLLANDSLATSREIRSMQAIRTLQHPHLLRIDRIWVYENYIVIAMELAEGSLLDLLDAYQAEFGTPIVPEQVCMYLSQAADALDFLNKRQHHIDGQLVAIQHCDIKPNNLLIFGDVVKLADYGLSSTTGTRGGLHAHRRAGTLDYTAPEVFQGQLSDKSDQYSLAITYCQLRGGRLPFTDTPSKFDRNYVRPEPDLTMLPEAERPIIARALSRVPQDRWPSCTEMMTELAKRIL
ncbi:MAG: hypothetical protein KatS3mg105_1496 [Gemmatales bacterium]|nr:MAG: hypothetical protein KatS3mg105_1496 [Gemmatales bacterium]